MIRRSCVSLCLVTGLAGCRARPENLPPSADSTGGRSSLGANPVTHITRLEDPESVRYDAEQDVFFISNMFGYGSAKDGVGYITRVRASDFSADNFVEGGTNGVTLNAPKGMAIVGDTLWVADIDVVRGFNRKTGSPVGTIDFAAFKPTLLNDVAAGPNGVIRVSDSGLLMSDKGVLYRTGDRVFEVDAHRTIRVAAEGSQLGHPNGLAWDPHDGRWLMVNFAPFESALVVLKDSVRSTLARGSGRFDGVEVLDDGRVLYTCWTDSSLHVYANAADARLIRNLPMPADIGVDTRRHRVAIPLSGAGRVEIWELPAATRSVAAADAATRR